MLRGETGKATIQKVIEDLSSSPEMRAATTGSIAMQHLLVATEAAPPASLGKAATRKVAAKPQGEHAGATEGQPQEEIPWSRKSGSPCIITIVVLASCGLLAVMSGFLATSCASCLAMLLPGSVRRGSLFTPLNFGLQRSAYAARQEDTDDEAVQDEAADLPRAPETPQPG
eukprot:TRINITY_DN13624_c0_g1_i2.p1 TRINITY_DN13624_c0_g1~~TRINITY_DN13624_c0_g1_i2.p1  ORF type:complete len:171 (+),score=36.40 TRINITY_DN13624_c0_g1_i2:233-745(+)